eukprot:TRINITY_DN3779_c0_g1_i1.p1 TRINITY_DN3779_c0_g1~~TRINITY_DN3779_c0_g1_i1.p1  ORF type:complete len:1091 (-),score=180.30 TRINITY_DN3779_c0_g1_i1:69-2927(-)
MSEYGTPWPTVDHEWSKEECLALKGTCPLWYCNLDLDPGCEERCLGEGPFQNGACVQQIASARFNIPISRPNMCEVRVQDTGGSKFDGDLCEALGGTFLGDPVTPLRQFGRCMKYFDASGVSTLTQCYTSSCIPNMKNDGVPCRSYCSLPSITDEGLCTGSTTSGFAMKWYEWDYNTACVLEDVTFQQCTDEPAVWVTGFDFLPEQWNSQEECQAGWCYQHSSVGPIHGVSAADCHDYRCTTCLTGDEEWCFDEEACLSTPACSNPGGCLRNTKAWEAMKERSDEEAFWTPLGYLAPLVSREECDLSLDYNDAYLEPLTTKEECDSYLWLCNGGSDSDADTSTGLSPNYTLRNPEDCTTCGGEPEPFWHWKAGQWKSKLSYRSADWVVNTPESRIEKPVWKKRLDPEKWRAQVEFGVYSRYIVLFTSRILCSYGAEKDALSKTSCSCSGGDDACKAELSTLEGQNIGFFGVCRNNPSTQHVSSVVLIKSTEDFQVSDQISDCVAFELAVVTFDQFKFNTKRVVTNLAIYSETSSVQIQNIFVYNDHGTVIGQIVKDGFKISHTLSGNITGLQSCHEFPSELSDPNWKLRMSIASWKMAYSTPPYKTFTLVDPASVNSSCINITDGVAYFPVGLVDGYEDLEIRETWTSEELGLIIFIAIMYTLLMFWLLYSFIGRVVTHVKNEDEGWSIPLGLGCILFQSILRSIYFLAVPSGAFDYENLAILFSDLPQLLFHSAVVTTGVLWYQIVAQAEGKTRSDRSIVISYFYVASLFIFFVSLNIAVGVLSNETQPEFTCASTQEDIDERTSTEIVLFVYKGIFAFYTFLIAVAFAIQSIKIVTLLSASASSTEGSSDTIQKKRDTMGKLAIDFAITSSLSVTGLLVQAAICIYTAVDDLTNTSKMAIIITCELLPTYGLAYLFRFVTPWVAAKTWMTKTSKSTSKKTSSSSATSAVL